MREATSGTASASLTFEELFSEYAGLVWRTLRYFGVAEADLEDQTQEVFLVAHRRLEQCDPERPHAWLYAVARRTASTYRRRSHRRHEEAVELVPESVDTRDPSARAEIDLLNRVLHSLDEDKQVVFLLYEVEGLSMREVAEIIKCPLQTAYTRLYAARRELTCALGEEK